MNTVYRTFMTLAIAVFTIIPPLVDLLTDTHVFHQGWMPHARMHTVWLLALTSGVGLVAFCLIWFETSATRFSVNLAGVLATVVFGAFFISASTITLYGGALSDLDGGVEKGPLGVDANLFTFSIAFALLLVGWIGAARTK